VGFESVWMHSLWMDVMEKVVGVGHVQVYPLWIDGMENMVGVGGNNPPQVV